MNVRRLTLATTIAAVLMVWSGMAQAQSKPAATSTAYACAKCDVASSKKGDCKACKAPLKATKGHVSYGCKACNSYSSKPGTCTTCSAKKEKFFVTYACDHCGTSASKPGQCTQCNHALDKKVIPMKG